MERKTVFVMCGTVIGLLVLLLLGLWVFSLFSNHYYEPAEVEGLIVEATEKYYRDNPVYLPTDDGTYNLSYSALVADDYIAPLGELIEGGDVCSANITVVRKNETFTYIPYLNCGDLYATKELAQIVIDNNPVVTTGSGLYQDENGVYYFKGKIENNYVSFGTYEEKGERVSYTWRIISIENGKVKLKSVEPIGDRLVWDDRYNSTEGKNVGYNDFDLSLLSDALKDFETNYDFMDESSIAKIEPTNLCIGTRELNDNISKGNLECTKLSKEQYLFGTMTPYEYMRASGDAECTTASNRTCSNFNYLSEGNHSSELLITTTAKSNYEVYAFEGFDFYLESAKYKKYYYPVITLSQYSFFNSGTGTLEDPYTIK